MTARYRLVATDPKTGAAVVLWDWLVLRRRGATLPAIARRLAEIQGFVDARVEVRPDPWLSEKNHA